MFASELTKGVGSFELCDELLLLSIAGGIDAFTDLLARLITAPARFGRPLPRIYTSR